MKKYHEVRNLRFRDECLLLEIDGQERSFKVREVSRVLEAATEEERNTCEISPSGYGIHWRLLDEDLSIDGLLDIKHRPSWVRKSA